jgi:hypothetical protein
MGSTGSGNSITVVGNNCLITLVNATTYSWTLPSDLDPAVGFSYLVVGGGGLQPALLRTQVINLMGDGKLLVTFTGITESTTITLPTIVNGMLYTAQEIVSEKDAAETFDSHNFSFEYAQWQNDRLLNRKFEQAYYVSIHDALVVHQSALGVLGVERLTQRSMGSKYFEAKAREIQAQWHQAQVMANNARQQALRALTYSDIANLRYFFLADFSLAMISWKPIRSA